MDSPTKLLIELIENLAREVSWAREESMVTADIGELYMELDALDRKALILEVTGDPNLFEKWIFEHKEIRDNIQGLQEYRESMRSQPKLPSE